MKLYKYQILNNFLIINIIFVFNSKSIAQEKLIRVKEKKDINKEKKNIRKKINQIEKILKEINKKKKASLGQLNTINLQINYKQNLINIINSEIKSLNKEIKEKGIKVGRLGKDLLKQKKEYEEIIYEGLKLMNKIDKILFIFSAKSFNGMFVRLKYINQYNEFRRNYLKKINITRSKLRSEQISAKNKKKEIEKLLSQYIQEKKEFASIKLTQIKTIEKLNKQTSKLKKELKQQNRLAKKVQKLIKSTIAKDLKIKELPKKSIKIKPKKITSPETKSKKIIPKGNFRKFKGKLPWPVKSGFISQKFGIRKHPVLKHAKIENLGIDIQTEKGAKAFAVFHGIVKAVIFIPGMQQLVIIQHGRYHTVYTKLKSAEVKVGQSIKPLDIIGVIFTNKNGITELQFQVWKNETKLNPQHWILRNN